MLMILQSLTARSSTSHQSSLITGHSSADDRKVPSQVYYDSIHTSGKRPSSRWGHACAAYEDRLFVFGGASSLWHSDSYVFKAGKFSFHQRLLQRVVEQEPGPTTYLQSCNYHDVHERVFAALDKCFCLDRGVSGVAHKGKSDYKP